MNNRFVITTAVGLVLASAAFAQAPSGSSPATQGQSPSASSPRSSSASETNGGAAQRQSQPSGSSASQPTTGQRPADKEAQAPDKDSTKSSDSAKGKDNVKSSEQAKDKDSAKSSEQANDSKNGKDTARSRDSANDTKQSAKDTKDAKETKDTAKSPTNDSKERAQSPAAKDGKESAQSPAARDGKDAAQSPAARDTKDSAQTKSSSTNADASVNIDTQERTRISQSISRLNVEPVTNVNFSISVGTVVPRSVRLRPLPAEVVEIVPQYRGYSFVVVRDEIVIIEPSSHKIVAVLPKSGGRAAAAPSSERRVKFSDKERDVIRRHARSTRERVTTGSSASMQLEIGERVPETVELIEFPVTIYEEVPSVREYRYIEVENRAYIVEPGNRTIIEVIE